VEEKKSYEAQLEDLKLHWVEMSSLQYKSKYLKNGDRTKQMNKFIFTAPSGMGGTWHLPYLCLFSNHGYEYGYRYGSVRKISYWYPEQMRIQIRIRSGISISVCSLQLCIPTFKPMEENFL